MRFDPGLDMFFLLLQEHEIPCGLDEIGRLKAVFSLTPSLDEDELRRVLEAVLVKSVDQRAAFRRVFSKWLGMVQDHFETIEAHENKKRERKKIKAISPEPSGPKPAARHRQAKRRAIEAAAAPGARDFHERKIAQRDESDESIARKPIASSPDETGSSPAPKPAGRPPTQDESSPEQPSDGPRQSKTQVIGGLIALVAVVAVVFLIIKVVGSGLPNGDIPRDAAVTSSQLDAGGENVGPFVTTENAEFYRPEITIERQPEPPPNWLAFGLAALSLIIGVGLWIRDRRGRWLPRALPRIGLPRAALLVAPGRPPGHRQAEALFLDEHDEENLVWGVGRFISDEKSDELDVERSVDETAGAFGRPVLRYENARYQREVWLWVDESIDSPAARHLARDLASLLERSGLPVLQANFWGIPDQLRTEKDEILVVDALDAKRDSVAVAILTDGRLMSAAHRARDRRGDLHRLLRTLSHWPRVTFIDFGREPRSLDAIVESHGLRVIQPRDAAAAVSDLAPDETPAEYRELAGDARVWAAACAISPQPVDDRTALSLRRILGLEVTPWVIEAMRERAASNAGGLRWSQEQRASLLDWLAGVEELPSDLGKRRAIGFGLISRTVKLPPGSLLDRIMDAWTELLDERERAIRTKESDWESSRRGQETALERAFVHLWDMPNRSSAALYELFQRGRLRRTISHYLGQMAPAECAEHPGQHPDLIILPWRLGNLRRETQVRLTEMGFGVGAHNMTAGQRSMPRPGRLYVALGLCLGLLAGSVAALVNTHYYPERPLPELVLPIGGDVPRVRGEVLEDCVDNGGACEYIARAPVVHVADAALGEQGAVRVQVQPGEIAVLDWVRDLTLPCREMTSTEHGSLSLLRCDSSQAPALRRDDRWSFAAFYADPNEPRMSDLAFQVAGEMLDSGSIDGAYLVYSPEGFAGIPLASLARANASDQLLIVAPRVTFDLQQYAGEAVVVQSDKLGLLSGVTDDFHGQQSLEQRFVELDRVMSGDTLFGSADTFLVHGQGPCGGEGEQCCNTGYAEPCVGVDLECVSDQCVEREQVCIPYERACDGNAVEVCDETGTQWNPGPECGDDARCVDGECKPTICPAGEPACIDDNTLGLCDSTGTGWSEVQECGRDLCVEGECRARECNPNERRCAQDYLSYYVCSARGTDWMGPRSCGDGKICVVGGVCQTQRCSPGTQRLRLSGSVRNSNTCSRRPSIVTTPSCS